MDTIFYIESTEVSPEIKFDLQQDLFLVKGRSMPEDSEGFYQPVIEWLKANAVGINRNINFDVILDYYNTGSFIRIMALFNCLHDLNQTGVSLRYVGFASLMMKTTLKMDILLRRL